MQRHVIKSLLQLYLFEDITLLLVEDNFKGNTGRIVHVRSDKKTGEIPFSRQCTLEKALHNIKKLKKIH